MTTQNSATETAKKELILAKNQNRKMSCPFFCHIQIAASNGGIPESVAENTVFLVTTSDGSHEPIEARLLDSVRCQLKDISSSFTWMSHAMSREEFIIEVLTKVKNTTMDTIMVIYFYKNLSV
jgi:ABC-type histidine transport system ATPase subunit